MYLYGFRQYLNSLIFVFASTAVNRSTGISITTAIACGSKYCILFLFFFHFYLCLIMTLFGLHKCVWLRSVAVISQKFTLLG